MSRKCSMNSTYSSYEKSASPPPSGANPVRTILDCPTGSMPSCVSVRTQLRKYADLSMLTPAILPPRIWDSVCGTKTRSKASAYSFRCRLLSGNPRCRPNRARTSSRRSEEHTSELQSQFHLVCRLLLEKKKIQHISAYLLKKKKKKK